MRSNIHAGGKLAAAEVTDKDLKKAELDSNPLTDGTLSVHLSKLEEGGIVTIEKVFEGKKPRTLVRVTPEGRRMFKAYLADLREVLPGL